MASKSKTELAKELREALSALKEYQIQDTIPAKLDFSWLQPRHAKAARHFLDRVTERRHCTDEKVIAACIAWCAKLAIKHHGLPRLLQTIELDTQCKI